jgi:uncharacterized protein with HEPN domain
VRDDLSPHDVLRALDRIQEQIPASRAAFEEDAKLQVWVLYHLQIVGEAVRGLSEDFRSRFPDPVWSKTVGLRNILVHHYFDIDHEIIWQVVQQDLPPFREKVVAAARALDSA